MDRDPSCILQAVEDVSSHFKLALKHEQVKAIQNFCEGHDVEYVG